MINCDFILGSVLLRPGKQSAFVFGNSFIKQNTKFVTSIPGANAPNETPWSNPTNAELDTPGTYAEVSLMGAGGLPNSQVLDCINYAMNIPATVQVLGLQVEIDGLQSGLQAGAQIAVTVGTTTIIAQLGTLFGTTDIGTPLSNWGLTLTPALLNDPNFPVKIVGSAPLIPNIGTGTTQLDAFAGAAAGGSESSTVVISANPSVPKDWALLATAQNGNKSTQNPGMWSILSLTISGNVLTITVSTPCSIAPGQTMTIGNQSGATAFLNGQTVVVGTNSGTVLTAPFVHANAANNVGFISANGWTGLGSNGSAGALMMQQFPSAAPVNFSGALSGTFSWAAVMGLFATNGIPALVQSASGSGATSKPQTEGFPNATQAGNSLFFVLQASLIPDAVPILGSTCTDTAGNLYTLVGMSQGPIDVSNFGSLVLIYFAQNTVSLPNTGHITLSLTDTFGAASVASATWTVLEISNLANVPAQIPTVFDIAAVKLKAWVSPNPPPSFNYIKTFAETGGEVLTLALGSNGIFYQEDAINNPTVLFPVYSAIEPNTFAQSATVDDREFIALSNLLNGTDMPRTYTPPNFDRLSQVGPGAPPSASSSSAASNILSITQPPVQSDPVEPGHLSGILWSSGPGSTVAGNVLTVYYAGTNNLAVADPNLVIGAGVQLAAINSSQFGGQTVNGDYIITGTGQGVPPGAAQSRWYFTVIMPTSQSINQANHIESHAPTGTYQVTTATLTAAAQVPNLEVGGTLQIAGTGGAPTAGYDGSWTVNATPNASQLLITSTSLNGNVATYGYTLISGSAPVAGQLVTITGTLNGNGIFNQSNQGIASASPGSFSINLFGNNVNSAAENGSGVIFGTIFQFDPLVIVGNKTGGNLVTSGIIGAGVRKVCYSFLTRNGFMTQPSPITTFDVNSGASAITISDLLPGPSNVIARVIHLTGANGGNFYNIPQPVVVNNNGVKVTNSSTWVNDNTSRSVTLSFSDGVLLAADQIDIEGNNLFENFELGSCVALIPYAERLFAVGEQNKIFNLLNCSFDGGIAGGSGSTASVPAGWTVDPTNGSGESVVASPQFGNAVQIFNQTVSTQALYGMITQPAFQDEFLVPIIEPSTTYSVRITCSCPTGAASGNLVVDLFSPSSGLILGQFTLSLASIGSTMQIFTGKMLTTTLSPVPADLLIRIYAANIPNGVQIQIDRVEPFPTETPNLNTQIIGSYTQAFEQFDRLSGVVQANQQNQQPVVTAFTLFGTLYVVKSGSFVAVNDNDTTEPANWTKPRVVSNSVGGFGPYSVTFGVDDPNSGEEWSLIAGPAGLFIFFGGQPVKLSEEIQAVWNQINTAFAYTTWVRNDVANRRILVGVPLKALNAQGQNPSWLPAGLLTDNNPSTPNVVLELNYKQLNTSSALADSVQIHRSYSGKLIASDIVRKWSIWLLKAPCAAFLQRADNSMPLFVGNSDATGKIYQMIDGLMQDDGAAINQLYATAGFVPSETGEARQIGVTRYTFEYMTLLIRGNGTVILTVYPNTLDTPYSHVLLPNLTLPASTNGDAEVPVNEVGNRLFVLFNSNAVGSGFNLARVVMVMTKDPWSPVRGVNS